MSSVPSTETPPEAPKGLFSKLGAALPIGLTALATVFAGMSTSALQQAMYWKSQAAQDQSKSSNQWSLFGFKRSRALQMEVAAQESRSASGYLRYQFKTEGEVATGVHAEAAKWLNGEGPPRVELPPPEDKNLVQLVKDIRDRKPETEILALAAKIPLANLTQAIDDSESFNFKTTGDEWDEVIKEAKAMAKKVVEASERTSPEDSVDPVKKARADAVQRLVFAMEDRRYRAEGALNNAIGYLYEARVKYSSAESDKHRRKSQQFFYAMLAAQIGAVVSSLAIARQKMSALWLLASLIGLVSIGIGVYVLLET